MLRLDALRVVISPDDHRPAHVHVIGRGWEALLDLRCPDGPPTLRENYGFGRRQVTRIVADLAAEVAIHGELRRVRGGTERARCRETGPHAVAARYDHSRGRVVVRLTTGLKVAFSPRDAQGLAAAAPADLDPVEISPSGSGLHFPKLDADLYLPGLLEGFLAPGFTAPLLSTFELLDAARQALDPRGHHDHIVAQRGQLVEHAAMNSRSTFSGMPFANPERRRPS